MKSKTGQQMIAIHLLSRNSRGKSNHTMKFGQLIEYDMKRFFLKIYPQNVMQS